LILVSIYRQEVSEQGVCLSSVTQLFSGIVLINLIWQGSRKSTWVEVHLIVYRFQADLPTVSFHTSCRLVE